MIQNFIIILKQVIEKNPGEDQNIENDELLQGNDVDILIEAEDEPTALTDEQVNL